MKEEPRDIPDWHETYRDGNIEELPWFFEGLDPDVEEALEIIEFTEGSVLDLGTGPGTQAIALGDRGFAVTATDISADAVRKARDRANRECVPIEFLQDDILESSLGKSFDLVLDRGVFHVFGSEWRPHYLRSIGDVVRPGGYLLLKCFDARETMEGGPYRFSESEVRGYFEENFEFLSVKETVYHGNLEPRPRALFFTMRRLGSESPGK